MRATPLNPAEGIVARFWDPLRSNLDAWQFRTAPAAGGALKQAWHAAYISWTRGVGQVGCLTREAALETEPYDHLNLCASLPAGATLTVTIEGEKGRRVVIDRQPGADTFAEYEGFLDGQRKIRTLTIEIADHSGGPGLCIIPWLGLFDRALREILRSRPRPDPADWDDLLAPAGQRLAAQPRLGLFFDAGMLDALRRKARQPPYADLVEGMRKYAQGHGADEPWRGIGTHPNNPAIRCGRGSRTPAIDLLAMRMCAFIGLLDDDPGLSRTALQHALAAAHCDDWSMDFLDTMPGHTFESRAFSQYRIATNLIFAWDWAGAYLTDAGAAVLAEAVAMKGLPRILHTLMRHQYVRSCNQGVYVAYGAILCELALAKVWRHGGELLDSAVRALEETVDSYFAADGGAFEGVGYVSSTLGHALVACQALARHRGETLAAVAPQRLRRCADYLTTMLSTAPPFGASINVADGGRPGHALYPDGLAALCALSEDPAVPALLAGMLTRDTVAHESGATPGSVFNFIFGPERLPPPAVRPPVFRILSQTGMLCSCRATEHGLIRLQLIGAPAGAGHAHEDKGSFVIEAFGEELAIERGQMAYDDPRCILIKHAWYHNLLIPAVDDKTRPAQINPCPKAVVPEGRGDERMLEASIDASAAWGPPVKRWVRSIVSPDPLNFVVNDAMALTAAHSAAFHLHSRFPWTKTAAGWTTRGRHGQLTVAPEWQPVEETGSPDFIDGGKTPVFHLVLKAGPSTAHELRTRLRLAPSGCG